MTTVPEVSSRSLHWTKVSSEFCVNALVIYCCDQANRSLDVRRILCIEDSRMFLNAYAASETWSLIGLRSLSKSSFSIFFEMTTDWLTLV